MKDKTQFTLGHAQIFFQTFAELLAEEYAPNIEVIAIVKKKEDINGKTRKSEKEQYTTAKN